MTNAFTPIEIQRPTILEFGNGILELNALVDHFVDQLFELVGNGHSSSRPVSRVNASTYFSRVFTTTSSGSDGTGGCLFQRIRSR